MLNDVCLEGVITYAPTRMPIAIAIEKLARVREEGKMTWSVRRYVAYASYCGREVDGRAAKFVVETYENSIERPTLHMFLMP